MEWNHKFPCDKIRNKKRQATNTASSNSVNNSLVSDSEIMERSNTKSSHFFIDSSEIKQETDIKEEPQSVGVLIDVPAMDNRDVGGVFDSNEYPVEYDFEHMNFDEVKTEVKTETDEKKEGNSKKSDDLADNRDDGHQNPMQQPQAEDNPIPMDIGNEGNNAKKRGGSADQKKIASKKYKCDVCEYNAVYKSQINRHMVKHTGKKPFGCKYCAKRFTTKRTLQSHKKAHVKEFLFHCDGCLDGFDDKDEKVEHQANCKVFRYECHICKQSFGSLKVNLIVHMRVHSGNKPFECKECLKQFARKQNLNEHMILHADSSLFRCSRCRRVFLQKDEQKVHEEKCNANVYECYICGKLIGPKKTNLEQHMRVHTGDRPFQCQHCLKQFKQKHTLDVHMKLHTMKLPFKCSICRYGFTKQTKCKAHERTCRWRCYHCHICKKFFGSKSNLENHLRSHSGDKPFQCTLCRIGFAVKSNLTKHTKSRIHKRIERI
ncbi:zinc finger protein OZF-like [Contarinia nasturtii]|uniref:zinc finger protein OZF-like n=1 Tax=Contarinia nasturtii TaxID=265458 RepID=UPI0012D452AF|nr:zinc finger protein OZF-like [Contarinia nasturtii]